MIVRVIRIVQGHDRVLVTLESPRDPRLIEGERLHVYFAPCEVSLPPDSEPELLPDFGRTVQEIIRGE